MLIKPVLQLSAQCNFGNEIQHILAFRNGLLGQSDVYFRLSRTCHSMQHHRLCLCKSGLYFRVCLLLCLTESETCSLSVGVSIYVGTLSLRCGFAGSRSLERRLGRLQFLADLRYAFFQCKFLLGAILGSLELLFLLCKSLLDLCYSSLHAADYLLPAFPGGLQRNGASLLKRDLHGRVGGLVDLADAAHVIFCNISPEPYLFLIYFLEVCLY